jgi:hypothetical protein
MDRLKQALDLNFETSTHVIHVNTNKVIRGVYNSLVDALLAELFACRNGLNYVIGQITFRSLQYLRKALDMKIKGRELLRGWHWNKE